jgi:hypothetical protein
VLHVPTRASRTFAAVLWLYRGLSGVGPPNDWWSFGCPEHWWNRPGAWIRSWISGLSQDVPEHVLLGGEGNDSRCWTLIPDQVRIFVGTQGNGPVLTVDVRLSRMTNELADEF